MSMGLKVWSAMRRILARFADRIWLGDELEREARRQFLAELYMNDAKRKLGQRVPSSMRREAFARSAAAQ